MAILADLPVGLHVISPNAETRMTSSIPAQKRAELTAATPMGDDF